MKPKFFIVGAPKCGTTSMAEYLDDHPSVFVCKPKEPNFFSSDLPKMMTVQSESDYLKLFDGLESSVQLTGEASTWYLFSEVAASNILQFDPDARFIVMLRNPVDMFFSLHSQFRYNMTEPQEMPRTAWEQQSTESGRIRNYREACGLGAQVARFLETVPREQVHFIVFEDLKKDPAGTYAAVLEFLDLSEHKVEDWSPRNTRKGHKSKALENLVKNPPSWMMGGWNAVKRTLGIKKLGLAEKVRDFNRSAKQAPQRDQALADELRGVFAEDVRRLGTLIDRDLSHWTKPKSIA